jgi:hypothetical protein
MSAIGMAETPKGMIIGGKTPGGRYFKEEYTMDTVIETLADRE